MTRPRTTRLAAAACVTAVSLVGAIGTAAHASGPVDGPTAVRLGSMTDGRIHTPADGSSAAPRAVSDPVGAPAKTRTQGTPRVQRDAAEGRAMPWDFDGDGDAELLSGAWVEDIAAATDAGMFIVLPGTASGLTASGSTGWNQDTPGMPSSAEKSDELGFSSASGDFDADGFADVAVSAPAEGVGGATGSGYVHVLYGSTSGLTTDRTAAVHAGSVGRAGDHAYFGEGLAAGDFNGDGYDELAVGAPGGEFVAAFPGSASGLVTDSAVVFDQDSAGIPGSSNQFASRFGSALAAGDANGDGFGDLAVGAPWDDETRDYATGSVTMLYGSATGLGAAGSQIWTKDSPGIDGAPHPFDDTNDMDDSFGATVALGDFDGDGYADLAAGAPGSDIVRDGTRRNDAGAISVLQGSATGIAADDVYLTEDSPGVPGTVAGNHTLGTTLSAGETNADGRVELAATAGGSQTVVVLTGTSGALGSGADRSYTQSSASVPGSTETGDAFGASLRFAAFDGDTGADLAIGAPGENSFAGSVTVLYSHGSGTSATGSKLFTQDTAGVPGTSESDDGFGSFF